MIGDNKITAKGAKYLAIYGNFENLEKIVLGNILGFSYRI